MAHFICSTMLRRGHVCLPAAAGQCLLTYNYVISDKDAGTASQRAVLTHSLPGGSAGRYSDTSQTRRCLLLAGRRDGCLCVLNWDTGAVDYLTKVMSTAVTTLVVPVEQSVHYVCVSLCPDNNF